jgi:hypothetical protein
MTEERVYYGSASNQQTIVQNAGLDFISQLRNSNASFPSLAMPFSNLDEAIHFELLATQIERETEVLSNPTQMLANNKVSVLKALDKPFVVNRILQRIDKSPLLWMVFLGNFTGANPIPAKDRGNVKAMVTHWKNWGRTYTNSK